MQRFLHARERAPGGPNRRVGLAAIALAGAVLVAAGCASSSSTAPSTASSRPFSPDVSSFSGELPSSVASAKSSLLESASAAASAAEASRSAAAASFEASVSAQLAAGRAEAQSVLAGTQGTGNALSDITITGLPKAQTAGINAALVTVVNSTSSTASYAIKVEFLDGDQVVDTTFLGVKDLAPGAKATPTAFSPLDRDKALVPRVAQAQRY
ncbi:hypothetical protein [Kitasatospora purpeofusca]|uniref:hypothetical protein n=1 Tax=Kitasatospora purpeofusca TaxID=67352 RepID=UPI0037FB1078